MFRHFETCFLRVSRLTGPNVSLFFYILNIWAKFHKFRFQTFFYTRFKTYLSQWKASLFKKIILWLIFFLNFYKKIPRTCFLRVPRLAGPNKSQIFCIQNSLVIEVGGLKKLLLLHFIVTAWYTLRTYFECPRHLVMLLVRLHPIHGLVCCEDCAYFTLLIYASVLKVLLLRYL